MNHVFCYGSALMRNDNGEMVVDGFCKEFPQDQRVTPAHFIQYGSLRECFEKRANFVRWLITGLEEGQ